MPGSHPPIIGHTLTILCGSLTARLCCSMPRTLARNWPERTEMSGLRMPAEANTAIPPCGTTARGHAPRDPAPQPQFWRHFLRHRQRLQWPGSGLHQARYSCDFTPARIWINGDFRAGARRPPNPRFPVRSSGKRQALPSAANCPERRPPGPGGRPRSARRPSHISRGR